MHFAIKNYICGIEIFPKFSIALVQGESCKVLESDITIKLSNLKIAGSMHPSISVKQI